MLYAQTETDDMEHYVGEVIDTLPVKQSGPSAWLSAYSVNSMRRNAVMQAEHERCRAYLAATCLNHAVVLTNLEASLNQTAPGGKERYKQLVDAYVGEAAKKIKKW